MHPDARPAWPAGGAPAEPRRPRHALLREFDPLTVTALLAAVVLSTLSLLRVLEDPYASDPSSFAGVIAVGVLGAQLAAWPAFAREPVDAGARLGRRLLQIGPIACIVAAAAQAAVAWPAAVRSAEVFPDVLSPSPLGTYAAAIALTFVANLVALVAGGAAGFVFVFLPVLSTVRVVRSGWFRGRDDAPRPVAERRRIGAALSTFVAVVVAAPVCLGVGAETASHGDLWRAGAALGELFEYPQSLPYLLGNLVWWVGVLLVPVGVAALVSLLRGALRPT